MAIKDVLLGDASAAAIAAIDKCTAVAGDIGAQVTAIAVEEEISVRSRVPDIPANFALHARLGKVFETYVKVQHD
jgi:predicted peptidase